MRLIKTSEKLLIWMHRQEITQIQLSREMGITRQSLSSKIDNNEFSPRDLMALKRIGFNDND